MRTPDAAALARTPYRKSNRFSGTGNCIMVGSAGGWGGIQDSKQHPDSTHRTTPHRQWATFLHAIKDHQLSS